MSKEDNINAYTKEQLLQSKQFTEIEKDALRVLLNGTTYTIDEAKKILDEFKNRKVE
jgi:hypothetical protein